jgi:hypothetical protein
LVFPCQYRSANAPASSSSTCYSYQKDKVAQPGNVPRIIALSKLDSIGYRILLIFFSLWRLKTHLAALNMECVLRSGVILFAKFLTSSNLIKITKFRSSQPEILYLLLLLLLLCK